MSLFKTLSLLTRDLFIISIPQIFPVFATSQIPEKNTIAFTPELILPAGEDYAASLNPYTGEKGKVRKGTIAATINNVAVLNKLLRENSPHTEEVAALIKAITDLLPSLRAAGIFDLFTPEEWLAQDTQPGRTLATLLYLQKYPHAITPQIEKRIQGLQSSAIKIIADEARLCLPKK